MSDSALLLGWFAVFVFSVTLHEAAHAWVAKRGGDLTAYSIGQVSLNPIPHMRREPFGMLLLPVISLFAVGWPIGYASAPFDPGWAERHHKRAAIMALAGPVSNLLVAIFSLLTIYIGLSAGIFYWGPQDYAQIVTAVDGSMLKGFATLLSMLLAMNLLLFVLNIMPIPPLDGSSAIPLFLNTRQTQRYREIIHQPVVSMVGILLIFMSIKYIFPPVYSLAIRILY